VSAPLVSVIIVSRGRPKSLGLCLLAVSQIQYHPFEIIVVADQQGLNAVRYVVLPGPIKMAHCDAANISIARNIGIDMAAGDVVVFLDDDSVPEPGWLFHLAAVFDDPEVMAAGGYVLGRNGISFESKAQIIDAMAVTTALEIDGLEPVTQAARDGMAVVTKGTNCAFRRTLFERIGGFDPAFAYFLDESDVNFRIAIAAMKTAIVPLAQVHHQSDSSQYRDENRRPYDLHQIGKSLAVFWRKHCDPAGHQKAKQCALKSQKHQLYRHMIAGHCEPRDVDRLLLSLKAGFAAGEREQFSDAPQMQPRSQEFSPFREAGNSLSRHEVVAGFRLSGNRVRKAAADLAQSGHIVSAYVLSRTALFHRVRFHADGYWEQTGGLFGRSIRAQPMFRWFSLRKRVADERKRLALVRHPWDIDSR